MDIFLFIFTVKTAVKVIEAGGFRVIKSLVFPEISLIRDS